MNKVELEKVYLEYPEVLTNESEKDADVLAIEEALEGKTTRLSKEELLRRLEETSTLHL